MSNSFGVKGGETAHNNNVVRSTNNKYLSDAPSALVKIIALAVVKNLQRSLDLCSI